MVIRGCELLGGQQVEAGRAIVRRFSSSPFMNRCHAYSLARLLACSCSEAFCSCARPRAPSGVLHFIAFRWLSLDSCFTNFWLPCKEFCFTLNSEHNYQGSSYGWCVLEHCYYSSVCAVVPIQACDNYMFWYILVVAVSLVLLEIGGWGRGDDHWRIRRYLSWSAH